MNDNIIDIFIPFADMQQAKATVEGIRGSGAPIGDIYLLAPVDVRWKSQDVKQLRPKAYILRMR